jgi:hypothetical protein
MNFIEQLEEEPLSELIRYRSGVPKDAVAFSGTLRKHPNDPDKCILLADPSGSDSAGSSPAILEFRKADIKAVEEMPSLVDETGHSRPVMRLWIRRGSLGVRYEPFEVDEPLRFHGGSRLHDHIMSSARGWSSGAF